MSKKTIWATFIIVLFAKTALTIYLSRLTQCAAPDRALSAIAVSSGDTFSYTGAMENFIQSNKYFFFNGKQNIYSGRLPHYSVPYYLFRAFTDQAMAYSLVVALQILMESFAIVALSLIGFHFFSHSGFYTMLGCSLISCTWTDWNYYICPESLSTSLLILFAFFFLKYRISSKKLFFILSACCFAILVTLKPYFILLMIPVTLEFKRNNTFSFPDLQNTAVHSMLFVSPLIILLLPWVIRNYHTQEKFILFQVNQYAGYNYSKSELACRNFISAWGGDFIFWEKTSAGCYFIPNENIKCEFDIPQYAFTARYGPKEVEEARKAFIELQRNYSASSDETIAKKFLAFTEEFKNEKPFRYYIISTLKLTWRFISNSGSYYLPINASNPCFHNYQLILKLFQSGIYWLAILLGIPGIIALGIIHRQWTLLAIPLLLIILFPVIFRGTEWRYFRTTEPILYLGVLYLIALFMKKTIFRTDYFNNAS